MVVAMVVVLVMMFRLIVSMLCNNTVRKQYRGFIILQQ